MYFVNIPDDGLPLSLNIEWNNIFDICDYFVTVRYRYYSAPYRTTAEGFCVSLLEHFR